MYCKIADFGRYVASVNFKDLYDTLYVQEPDVRRLMNVL